MVPVTDSFAERVLSGELATSIGFVNDNDRLRIHVLMFHEAATCTQLYPHCTKVVRADFEAASRCTDLTRTVARHSPRNIQRKTPDRRSLHPGKTFDTCKKIPVEIL